MLSAWGNDRARARSRRGAGRRVRERRRFHPQPVTLVVAKEPTASGDAQTGPVSEPLPNNLRIVVTRDGSPQSGVTVNWSTATGSLAPTSGPTGGDGIAASGWTLGPTAGAQSAQATVAERRARRSPSAPRPRPDRRRWCWPRSRPRAAMCRPAVSEALPNDLRIIVTRDGAPKRASR